MHACSEASNCLCRQGHTEQGSIYPNRELNASHLCTRGSTDTRAGASEVPRCCLTGEDSKSDCACTVARSTDGSVLPALETATAGRAELVSRARDEMYPWKKESPSGPVPLDITENDGRSDITLPICTDPTACRDDVAVTCEASSIESCLECSLLRSFSAERAPADAK